VCGNIARCQGGPAIRVSDYTRLPLLVERGGGGGGGNGGVLLYNPSGSLGVLT